MEEAFFDLLATDSNLDELTLTPAHLADVLRRLGDLDRERFLQLRNGMVRSLRIPDPLLPGRAVEVLSTARNTGSKADRGTYDRAMNLLEEDPREFWNLVTRFRLPTLISERRATLQFLAEALPEPQDRDPILPSTLALPLIPATGRWLIATLVEDDDSLHAMEQRARTPDIFPEDLRDAIRVLGERADWDVPQTEDDWATLALTLLRIGLEDPEATVHHAASRAFEAERHFRVAARLQQGGNPWLALRSIQVGLLLQSDHERLGKARKFLETTLTTSTEELVVHPEGRIVRTGNEDGAWSVADPIALPTPPPESPALPPSLTRILQEAGYPTPEALDAATDEELLCVSGVGPRRLAQIRANRLNPDSPQTPITEPPKEEPSPPVQELSLPTALHTALEAAGIHTVAELNQSEDAELLAIPGVGPARLQTLRDVLASI